MTAMQQPPLNEWKGIRTKLYEALDMLNEEQLEFVPLERLWSLGTTARHIAAAEKGWFQYVVMQAIDGWPPAFEPAQYGTIAAVKDLLASVHATTVDYLESLDASELERRITLPWGVDVSLRWVIWHIFEHEIHHRGEIFLMLGLMGMEAPDV